MRALPPFDGNALNITEYLIAPGESIWGIAPSPDGTIYVMAGSSLIPSQDPKYRILKRTPDGQVRQVAGAASRGYSPDGTPAAETSLTIYDIAAGPDGSLYVSEGARIRRIGPDGILTTVAGTGTSGYTGDGGPALAARIWGIYLRIGADGTIYLSDGATIRRIAADGVISTLIGNGQTASVVDGASARGPLSISAFSVAPDSSLYFVEAPNPSVKHIWRVAPPQPGYEARQTVLASRDGSELFVFSAEGRHLRTKDALTGALKYQFEYDDEGLLGAVVDGDNLRTAITRDSAGRPTAIMSPNGQQTAFTLDPNGYLASISDPGGNAYDFAYQPNGLMATLTDPRRNVHSFEFDEVGRLKKDSDPSGGFTTLAREGDSKDYTVTKSTAESRATAYRVESFGDGNSRKRTTDPAGLMITRTTDPSGNIVWSAPDGTNGTVTIGPDPQLGMQAPLARSRVTRLPSGSQMTVDMSRAVTQGESGELTSRVDTITVNTKPFASTYNAAARTVTSVSPMGRQIVTTFDDRGRVLGVQAANLAPAGYGYDSRGRLTSMTVGTGASARVTTFAYDELDRLTSVTDPLTRVQQYRYDDANRVVGQTFADGNEVAFSYDANGNVASVTPPGRPEHGFGFTPVDLMSSYTPPTVVGTGATTYEYNLDKQPTVIHRPDGSTINFTYDSAGRLSTTTYPKGPEASDGTVTVTRTYNPTTGQLTGVTTSDGQNLAYGYDGILVTSTTWSGNVAGSVGWTYNNDFRVVSETVNGANSVVVGYDNDGLLTSIDGLTITRDSTNGLVTDTTLGGVTDHRTYDSFGQVATYEARFGTSSLYSVVHTHDSLGRIETKTETIQGTTTDWGYSYDSAGRLWQVMKNGALSATYLYDANGNRTNVNTTSGTQTATYDVQDRLQTYGNWAYTYTPNGDLQSKTDTSTGQVTTYTYDGQGNLRHVDLPDGRAIDYVIDSENRRVAKKVNGAVVRKWIYEDQLKPVAEFDGAGTLLARYLNGVTLKSGVSYRVVTDHLGTPKLLVNSSTGAVAQRLDFDEWGQVTSNSAVDFQSFGFAGGIYDPDTGLIRFGARDYDPSVGRWTAKDAFGFGGGSALFYEYCQSDPINSVDPSGLKTNQNLFNPNDPKGPYQEANAGPATQNYSVGAHGNQRGIIDADGHKMSARDLARKIIDDPNYTPGEPVDLLACRTGRGKNNFAQQLANELGADVNAPNDYIWYYPNGSTQVAPAQGGNLKSGPDLSNPGKMKTFTPK
jgi:RHS repeat-associated protein